MSAAALVDQVFALSVDDRAILAHRIWESIEHFLSPAVEQAWLDEAERRWREIEAGEIQCIPAKDAIKLARMSLAS